MIVLGIDPAASTVKKKIGWALLEVPLIGRPVWIEHGSALAGWAASYWLGAFSNVAIELICIEETFVGGRAAAKAVMLTNAEAHRIQGIFQGLGANVAMYRQNEWRKSVIGRSKRDGNTTIDRMCTLALERLVVGIPKRVPGHARDAAGVAIHGARVHMFNTAKAKGEKWV